MSLDVYLVGEEKEVACICAACGNSHTFQDREEFYWANITNNLGDMADEAGIYTAMWRPDAIGAKYARDIIEPLRKGLELLKSDPPRFEKHNAENGWGLYKHFVPFVEEYLKACEEYPDATIRVSR